MDKLPYPAHLKPISEVIEQTEISATFRLRCSCGCSRFFFERADYSAEERAELRAHEEACRAAREAGYHVKQGVDQQKRRVMLRRQGALGCWESFDCPPIPEGYFVTAICAVCEACGTAHLVMDNRLHGFEAAMGYPVPPMTCKPQWEAIPPANVARACRVEVVYSAPRSVFAKAKPGVDYDNAFGRMEVCGEDEQGNLTKLLVAIS